MFGQKFKKEHLMNAFNKTQNFVGEAYSKSKNILNNIDNGIKIGKHIHSSISPLLDKYLEIIARLYMIMSCMELLNMMI